VLKDGEEVRLKLLGLVDIRALCKMMASLGPETKRFFNNPLFNVSGALSFLKAYFLLASLTLANRLLGPCLLCVVALNKRGEVVGHVHIRAPLRYFLLARQGLARARYGVVVRDDYQGKGLGTFLTRAILRVAKRAGIRTVDLFVQANNIRALRLYKRFGFTVAGSTRRGGTVIYYMVLHLR